MTSSGRAVPQGSYFFLSYAHSPPLDGALTEDQALEPADKWVRAFFHDLAVAVRSHAAPPAPDVPGFFDQNIPLGANWKAVLSRALGTAEVFVPLYSPAYRSRSWPGREWASFHQRLTEAKVEEPLRRFLPVLWIPLPAGQELPALQAAEDLAPPEAAGPYRENGLRALQRIDLYRSSYKLVVDRLAARIVRLAERAPIKPSDVPDIDDMNSAFESSQGDAPLLTVMVVAPSLDEVPAQHTPVAYGLTETDWRPFWADQELPLAEYARFTAEQFDFTALIGGIDATESPLDRSPGVILIDPWYLATAGGRDRFQEFVTELPLWAQPLLCLSPGAERLADEVRERLRNAGLARSEPAKRGLNGVGSLQEFFTLMPYLIAQAEREYLRRGPIQRSPAPPRLRLARSAEENANPESRDV